MSYSRIEMIVLCVVITIFSGFVIVFMIKMLKILHAKDTAHENELLATKYKFENELCQAQLEIQEQTFQQISREIHDNVGQSISLAKLGLTTLDLHKSSEAELGIAEIVDILEKTLYDLRDISRTMSSDIVNQIGLKNAIESQVGFLQRSGKFHVQFEASCGPLPKSEQKEMIFYRILQESLNNIIKHARANEVSILLSYVKNELKMFIQDDGSGFDLESILGGASKIGGIGNMQVRAGMIDAKFSIESRVGEGTRVTVTTTL